MTTFGDATPADVLDPTAPADPAAVARILLELLRARIPGGFRTWDQHTRAEQAAWVDALGLLLARIRAEGSSR